MAEATNSLDALTTRLNAIDVLLAEIGKKLAALESVINDPLTALNDDPPPADKDDRA